MAKKIFWAVAWGCRDNPVIRYVESPSEKGAKMKAFGLSSRNMTAVQLSGNPKYLPKRELSKALARLEDLYRENCTL